MPLKKTTYAVDKFPPSIQGRNFLSMSPKQDHIGSLYCIRIDSSIRFHMSHTNTDPHTGAPGIRACTDNVPTEIQFTMRIEKFYDLGINRT